MSSSSSSTPKYTLHYWPSIPGRGEFIRLLFEYTGTHYEEDNDVPSLQKILNDQGHFAVPVLSVKESGSGEEEEWYLSQTPAIVAFLSQRLKLDGAAASSQGAQAERIRASHLQLLLTILDLNNEAHDTHHPIASSMYYEEQVDEAKAKAKVFRSERLPKFLAHFEERLQRGKGRLISSSGGGSGGGQTITAADLALWHVLTGLEFAFPKLMKRLLPEYKSVETFKEQIEGTKEIKAYVGSGRRKEFSMGVFRHYPELDE